MGVLKSDKQNVPVSRVRLPSGFNVRGDDLPEAERDMIARSIKDHGLIHDVSVEEHEEEVGRGKKQKVHLVTEGFGRAGGIIHLWKQAGSPKDWAVTVTVVDYKNRIDPFMRNLVENVHRRELRTADLAKRLWELANGACPDPKGGFVTERVSVKKLAEELQKSESFVRELVRAWGGAGVALRDAWRREVVRTDHVRAWCKLSDSEQREKLQAHLRGEDTLDAGAKKNGAAHEPEEGGGDEEESARGRTRAREDEPPKAPTRSVILERAAAFEKRLDEGGLKGAELERTRAVWNALRWAAGEVRTLRVS